MIVCWSSIASRPFRLRSKCSICSRRFESRRWSHRGQALSSGFLDIGRDHPSSLGPVPRIVSTLQCRRVRSTPVSFGKRDPIIANNWKQQLLTHTMVKLWHFFLWNMWSERERETYMYQPVIRQTLNCHIYMYHFSVMNWLLVGCGSDIYSINDVYGSKECRAQENNKTGCLLQLTKR